MMARTIRYTRGAQGGSGMFAGVSATPGPRNLTSDQARRRMIRDKLLQAAGFKAGTQVYGANADPKALAFLKGGTGVGKGVGLAQRDTQQALARRRRARKAGGPAGGRPVM